MQLAARPVAEMVSARLGGIRSRDKALRVVTLALGVLAENVTPTVQIPSYFSKRAASSGHLRVHLKRADRPDRSTPVAREALQKISQLLKALAVTPTPIAVTSTSGTMTPIAIAPPFERPGVPPSGVRGTVVR